MTEPIDWEAKAQELAVRFGYKPTGETGTFDPRWYKGDVPFYALPKYHESVDALLADMPDDWLPILRRHYPTNMWDCRIERGPHGFEVIGRTSGRNQYTDTAAHALLLACLSVE